MPDPMHFPHFMDFPLELQRMVLDHITDPCDISAVRQTHPHLRLWLTFPKIQPHPEPWAIDEPWIRRPYELCKVEHHYDKLHEPQQIWAPRLFHAVHYIQRRFALHVLSQLKGLEAYENRWNYRPGHRVSAQVLCRGLLTAACTGNVEMIKLCLGAGAHLADFRWIIWHDYGSALHQAARKGHLEAVKCLVERGAPLDTLVSGRTALRIAVQGHHLEIVEYLISKGAQTFLDCAEPRVNNAWPNAILQPLSAAACGSGGKKGWCQRMMLALLGAANRRSAYKSVKWTAQDNFHPMKEDEFAKLEVGNTVLHHICDKVKSTRDMVLEEHCGIDEGTFILDSRRDCGPECAVWKGGGKLMSSHDMWVMLCYDYDADLEKKNSQGLTPKEMWS